MSNASRSDQVRGGQYVLLKYPKKPQDKLSALYHGPMEIVAMDRPGIVKLRDLKSDKVSSGTYQQAVIIQAPC